MALREYKRVGNRVGCLYVYVAWGWTEKTSMNWGVGKVERKGELRAELVDNRKLAHDTFPDGKFMELGYTPARRGAEKQGDGVIALGFPTYPGWLWIGIW